MRDLQVLHDDLNNKFWNTDGLTDTGKNRVKRLTEQIENGAL